MLQFTRIRRAGALCLVLGSLTGCWQSAPEATQQPPVAPAAVAWQPTVVKHAKGFLIQYFDHYKVVSILNPFEGRTDTTRYLLVPRGAARPAVYPGSPVVEIPIRSLVGMSSMHVALVDFLAADSVLVGLGSTQYVWSAAVRRRIAAGQIKEVGTDKSLNEEQLIAQHPDLVMMMGNAGSPFRQYERLTEAGVNVMINSEWVENTPLGRAEWVKLLAALLNKEALVNEKFAQVEREYQRLTALTRPLTHRPAVVANLPFKDTWYLPGGQSFQAQFFRDAGADYYWNADHSTGSLALSFEAVAPVALAADFWLNPGTADTRADIRAQDARYQEFRPFKERTIFNNNKRVNAQGSNDYWESSAVHPDVVLADLIRILHPELLPGHELVYYKPVR